MADRHGHVASVEVIPVPGIPDVESGADLVSLTADALASSHVELQDDDVVVVTQKIVSKAEGRVVPIEPNGKASWVARETMRVVARRGDLVIAETRHGFVCANAGVDESNVAPGYLTLLPEDPDATAERLRKGFEPLVRPAPNASDRPLGPRIGVIITDTFGRAWRRGVVNVAIGAAGLPSLVDLRGATDWVGRELEATVVALADEIAAASGLVMKKASGVPVAIVRGLDLRGMESPAAELVRPPEEDLFRRGEGASAVEERGDHDA
jgi:coenzyme F420-0:L-glutamate ligase / coenzyme F420-1:gamma-L-glutamate ligase